ncbi:cell wall hydrolase [Terricaulis silvestris]|nr:cell wall hydrolase [Terricaulis silvestris]
MAARWVGLTRPHKKINARGGARRGVTQTVNDFLHAIGAAGFLVIAAVMNFALFPDALAAVVSGERPIIGFVPNEQQLAVAPQLTLPLLPVDEEEVRLLAATAWGEARSEGEDGMRAVSHVMVNRVGQRFGENLATVILSPKQFSVWNRGDPNRRLVQNLARDPARYNGGAEAEWEIAQRVAREVLSGQSVDPTHGALFYHTRAIRPRWSRVGQGRQVIGAHVFYADVPDPGVRATPRTIDVAQFFRASVPVERASTQRRGRRAGRVNGVIQYAPTDVPAPTTTIDSNAAATPTMNGAPVTTSATTTTGATS